MRRSGKKGRKVRFSRRISAATFGSLLEVSEHNGLMGNNWLPEIRQVLRPSSRPLGYGIPTRSNWTSPSGNRRAEVVAYAMETVVR